nr:conserved hypothetical protein [Streptomyces ambofaciens ATCC 23877]
MSHTLPASPYTDGPGEDAPAASAGALEIRNRQLARAAVQPAQRILAHRYRLAGPSEAFELLKQTSQRFNIKLHTLADAVLRVAEPDAGAGQWFPRRARFAAPALPGLALQGAGSEGHAVVLRAALRRVLHVTETDMGNVQLAEHGVLRLEKHTGLNRHFTDFFASSSTESDKSGQTETTPAVASTTGWLPSRETRKAQPNSSQGRQ